MTTTVEPVDALMADLRERVGPVDGVYLRPFVADGDPSECPVVLLGYNAATTIPAEAMPLDEYCELLFDRPSFEARYRRVRIRAGKSIMSPTRKRLEALRQAFPGYRIVETNINAWPTRNLQELQRLGSKQLATGRSIATWTCGLLKPQLVVAYGAVIQIPTSITAIVDFQIQDRPIRLNDVVDYFPRTIWNDHPTAVAHIKLHLAARGPGITGEYFRSLGSAIRQQFENGPALGHITAPTLARNPPPTAPLTEDAWHDYLSKFFDIFGDGKQTSRRSYRLPGDPRRLFKVEKGSLGRRKVSLMTRNFDTDQEVLEHELTELGALPRRKARYLEIEVASVEQAITCLEAFLRRARVNYTLRP